MEVRELMLTNLALVSPETPLPEVARVMIARENPCALVCDDQGRLVGLIAKHDIVRLLADLGDVTEVTAGELMIPRGEIVTIQADEDSVTAADLMTERRIEQVPVLVDERPVGILDHDATRADTLSRDLARQGRLTWDQKARTILKALHDGLIVVDKDMIVREFNDAAGRLTGLDPAERIGQKARVVSTSASPFFDVLATGQPIYNFETPIEGNRVWLVNYVPLFEDGVVTGVVQTFADITGAKQAAEQLRKAKDELDKAFALTLPNSRVEYKLKSTPEYRDEPDLAAGVIRVTGIIQSGSYIHVVNALKVAADLNDKGVMGLIGIDKDALVQAIIFHDIGKAQPELSIGETVDPHVVFEEGRRHAARSADIAGHHYGKSGEVVQIIRYHHHTEEDLPDDFPAYLLPMLRLLQVIDGLSAALTRRNAAVEIDRSGAWVNINERNSHPDYNRRWGINLLTGERRLHTEPQLMSDGGTLVARD